MLFRSIRDICKRRNLALEQILYIGDDMNDTEAIRTAGVGCAVNDALKEAKEAADYITSARGGEGAFREVAVMVLGG